MFELKEVTTVSDVRMNEKKTKDMDKVKEMLNSLANFRPIHREEEREVGPTAKCCNCGKEKPVMQMNYGNLDEGVKGYLCWECFGKPYEHCRGIEGCPEHGCILPGEDLEWISYEIDLHATYITGAECVSFSGYEICKRKIKELLDSGEIFQCRKCEGYFTMELMAEAYMEALGGDDVCASCYHEEQKNSEEKETKYEINSCKKS